MSDATKSRAAWQIPPEAVRRYTLAIAAHAALILIWYLVVTYGRIPTFVLPSPVATIASLGGSNYHWIGNTLVTASEIFGGYFLSVVIGVAIADAGMLACQSSFPESVSKARKVRSPSQSTIRSVSSYFNASVRQRYTQWP